MNRTISIALIALILGAAGGWFLHTSKNAPKIDTSLNPTQTAALRIFADLVGRLQKHDAAVTAESQRLLALNKVYRDSLANVTPRPGRDTVWIRDATTPRDSAARCSVVLLDCERRAALAEARASLLQTQLSKQVALQPHRIAVTFGVGPSVLVFPRRTVGLGANLSLSLRLW